MKITSRVAGLGLLGLAFGVVTSVLNAAGSPYSDLGASLDGTFIGRVAGALSPTFGAAWGWAVFGVVVGRLAGSTRRGAVAGALALVLATAAYYPMDSVLRNEPLGSFAPELVIWTVAGLVLGPFLGAAGANVWRPGLLGLLAGLAVPLLTAGQMYAAPPTGTVDHPEGAWSPLVVWPLVALVAGAVVARFAATHRDQR